MLKTSHDNINCVLSLVNLRFQIRHHSTNTTHEHAIFFIKKIIIFNYTPKLKLNFVLNVKIDRI